MNLGEFYNEAVKIAEEQGYKNAHIRSISGVYNGMIMHYINFWDFDKTKFVNSGLFTNIDSALEGFKDKLIESSKKQNNEPQMY